MRKRSCWFMAFSTVKIEKSKQMKIWMISMFIIHDIQKLINLFFGVYISHLLTLVEYRCDWIKFLIYDTLYRMNRRPQHLTVHRSRSFRIKLRHFKNNPLIYSNKWSIIHIQILKIDRKLLFNIRHYWTHIITNRFLFLIVYILAFSLQTDIHLNSHSKI